MSKQDKAHNLSEVTEYENTIIKAIVKFTHGGNGLIVETDDFIAGVRYTLKYFALNKPTKNQ